MKKYLGSFLFLLFVCGCYFASVQASSLKDVSLEYCDTTNSTLNYIINPEVQTGICYILKNVSNEPVIMKINFIDGTFTNDKRQNKACLDESTKENFGQYVTQYSDIVTLTGGESKIENAKLLYPKGMDGQYHGCITYSVVDMPVGETGVSSNFTILMRKAKFIDVLVGHPEDLIGSVGLKDFSTPGSKNLSPNSKIRIYQDPGDNKYVIEITVQNIGGVEENIVITGVVSNFLTYKNTFVETRRLLKGQEFIITKKLDEIPNFNLHVDIQLSYTPVIPGITDIAPKTTSFHESASIFIINIITIATVIGILLVVLIIVLLIRSTRRKRKQESQVIPGGAPIVPTPITPLQS
ncbi:MAG: hypothetical protein NTY80_01305 [candidate division SR1 bacterium]|nr:hypothetical protein [candidate division SR1 bacterium]